MIGGLEYKLWIAGKVVSDHFYTLIETITVEQGIDLATEARLELVIFANDQGKWGGPTDPHAMTWKRLRLEIRNQTSTWVPLIDGPIVTWDASMSGEPGQSTITIIARDDTAYLNVCAKPAVFEDKTDEAVIRKLFEKADSITCVKIDRIPDLPADRPLKHIKRGTEIDMIRAIADPYDLHVYVVPDTLNTSIAYVKRLATTDTSGLPVFVLTGSDRNVETFQARNDVAKASRYQGQQQNIDDPGAAPPNPIVSKFTADDGMPPLTTKPNPYDTTSLDSKPNPYGDSSTGSKPNPYGEPVTLIDKSSALDSLANLGTEIISPFVSAFRDVGELIQRWQQRSSYTITATGSVRYGCYDGVLRAYDLVGVSGANAKLCTNFIVREVTHTLSRSEYRQDFTLMTNATRTVTKGAGAVPTNVF
ncbi:MAG: hypothetical protein ABI591_34065 [Kofleriaceae bacterium]